MRTRYNCPPGRHGCLCHWSHWLGGLLSVPFWRRVPEEAPLEGLAGWTLIMGRGQGGGDHRAGPEQFLRSQGAGSDATPGPAHESPTLRVPCGDSLGSGNRRGDTKKPGAQTGSQGSVALGRGVQTGLICKEALPQARVWGRRINFSRPVKLGQGRVLPTEGGGVRSRGGVHAAWPPARAGQLLQGSDKDGSGGTVGRPSSLGLEGRVLRIRNRHGHCHLCFLFPES